MANQTGSLEQVRDVLTRARLNKTPFAMFVGEGCSLTAGIPTPEELVFSLRRAFPEAYRRAREKNLAACLSALSPEEQQRFLGPYCDRAQVNPAHLAVGHLLRAGYIDRILTTNFDPLLLRACALVGEFPAVYDLSMGGKLPDRCLPQKAIIYLKGQRTCVVPAPPAATLEHLFEQVHQDRSWLVVGYEGLHDPLFPHVAQLPQAGQQLFWVGQSGDLLAEHLQRCLRGTFVPGHSADASLVTLLRQLGDVEEDFAGALLGHPHASLETLEATGLTLSPQPKSVEALGVSRELIEADRLAGCALLKAKHEADTLFEQAFARYAEASVLSPGEADVLIRWGNALGEQAKVKTGQDAERLLALACEKYSRAAHLQPAEARIEYLWGLALSRRAQLTRGDVSEQLVRDAMVHLSNAEDHTPGSAAYLLACLCGARGDATQVRLWLTRGKVSGMLPARSTVESAEALSAYSAEPWFEALFS